MLTALAITVALPAGALLLALASDAFAYELSRGVEATFDFFEYRAALRRARRREFNERAGAEVSYEATYSHAA
jgi:hypothetical protein